MFADSPGSGSSITNSSSPLLSQQLNQISREMVDLLKQTSNCRMPISKFIPSYHHFFGRQCRVADYGYNRLKDLFEAIPHVVQVSEYICGIGICIPQGPGPKTSWESGLSKSNTAKPSNDFSEITGQISMMHDNNDHVVHNYYTSQGPESSPNWE